MQALYGRFEDNPPRWGGTRIKLYWPGSDLNDPNSLDKLKEPVICTAGFPAISEGYEVMATAGHCAPYGAASTPRWAWNGKSLTEGGILCALAGCRHREVGSVWKTMAKTYSTQTQAVGNSSVVDMAWVFLHTTPAANNYGASYYTGTSSGDVINHAQDTYPSPSTDYTGLTMCVSGATNFRSCGWKVTGRDLTVATVKGSATGGTTQYIYTYGWRMTSTQGGCVGGGDSGGIVWFVANDGKWATAGVISSATSELCGTSLAFATWADARIYFPSLTPKLQ